MSQPFSTEEIAQFRKDTPVCSHVIHLNSAGSSVMPQIVINAIQNHIELEDNIGGYEASDLKEKDILKFLRGPRGAGSHYFKTR
jgi:hypothetical protein